MPYKKPYCRRKLIGLLHPEQAFPCAHSIERLEKSTPPTYRVMKKPFKDECITGTGFAHSTDG